MPQSLAQILVHLVFSTKNREPCLVENLRDELHAYIGGIVERLNGTLLKAEHHRKVTFQEEYRRLLKKYDLQFDENYVWD